MEFWRPSPLVLVLVYFHAQSLDLLAKDSRYVRPLRGGNERICPEEFALYKELYDYRAPCCLCALENLGAAYTESVVYIAHSGPYTGEYVAGCATGSCGYLGASNIHPTSRSMATDLRLEPCDISCSPF